MELKASRFDFDMHACTLCPRNCRADRLGGHAGFCGAGVLPSVARARPHLWEEPCISGNRGSGTVFFTGCSLRCAFCQNAVISRNPAAGCEIPVERLAEIFLELQAAGVHNINLVNPTHQAHAVLAALRLVQNASSASRRLQVPVVWNSGGYDAVKTVETMSGAVSVWLPDLKFCDAALAGSLAAAPDYFERATAAIRAMVRLSGPPTYDADGLLLRGTMIRHLVLPGHTHDSIRILEWIASEFGNEVPISLMSQYTPMGEGEPAPSRRLSRREYGRVMDAMDRLGLDNGFLQDRSSSGTDRIPDFNGEGVLRAFDGASPNGEEGRPE